MVVETTNNKEFAAINKFKKGIFYDNSTPFFIGSVSKIFTAITVLKLCEEGKLSLSDSLAKFPFAKKLNKKIAGYITISNLLKHTSGIADFTLKVLDSSYLEQNLHTLPILDRSLNLSEDYILYNLIDSMEAEPGEKCIYSNSNFYLLSKIIEDAANMPYSEAVSQFIIIPLGLKNTYPYISEKINGIMHSYDDYGNDILDHKMNELNKIYKGFGNITSSLKDLMSLFQHLLITKDIVSQNSLNKMLGFIQSENKSFDCGLGILKINQLSNIYFGHQGDILASQIDVFFNPESKLIFSFVTTESNESVKNKILTDILLHCKKIIENK